MLDRIIKSPLLQQCLLRQSVRVAGVSAVQGYNINPKKSKHTFKSPSIELVPSVAPNASPNGSKELKCIGHENLYFVSGLLHTYVK